MSVRAYKIIKMEWEKDSTFNLWHDEFLNDYLNPECKEGYFEVSKDDVMIALFNIKQAPKDRQEDYKEILQGLLDDMKKNDSNYLEFITY